MSSAPLKPRKVPHLEPLDALRFFGALWVALHHGPKPFSVEEIPHFNAAWDSTFFGIGGVLVFFVLSGICIHFPFAASAEHPRWGAFLIRRYLRVLVPYWIILPLAMAAGRHYSIINGGDIAWTLFCELGFYLLYPFLFQASRRIGWLNLCLISAVVSFALLFIGKNVPTCFGGIYDTFVFLPGWLFGVVIADRFAKSRETIREISRSEVIGYRCLVFAAQFAVSCLNVNGIIYYKYIAIFLSLVMARWIWIEMAYYRHRVPNRTLSWAGNWSYSLYLTHPVAYHGIVQLIIYWAPKQLFQVEAHRIISFIVIWIVTLVFAYVFARLIEWPTQRLARFVSRAIPF